MGGCPLGSCSLVLPNSRKLTELNILFFFFFFLFVPYLPPRDKPCPRPVDVCAILLELYRLFLPSPTQLFRWDPAGVLLFLQIQVQVRRPGGRSSADVKRRESNLATEAQAMFLCRAVVLLVYLLCLPCITAKAREEGVGSSWANHPDHGWSSRP